MKILERVLSFVAIACLFFGIFHGVFGTQNVISGIESMQLEPALTTQVTDRVQVDGLLLLFFGITNAITAGALATLIRRLRIGGTLS